MDRNLDRRVEAVAPVEDHEAQARLATIIDVMLADDRRSWQLRPDATWVRTEALEGREGTIDTFEVMKEDALDARQRRRDAPHRPGCRRRLAGPARMSQTTVERPIEVELKYRVVDLAAAERYLVAEEIGSFTGHGRAALDAARGSLRGHGRRRDDDGPGFAVRLRQPGSGTIVSVKSLARTEGAGRVDAPRGARRVRPTGRPGRSTGPPRTPGRSCSSWPVTRRWSSWSRSASCAASGSSATATRGSS